MFYHLRKLSSSASLPVSKFIERRPGHAINTVGDSLGYPSGGELASLVHRVVSLRQTQTEDLYSIAYFLRPNDKLRANDTTRRQFYWTEWHITNLILKCPITLDANGRFLTAMRVENDRGVESCSKILVAA
jgi:hypothetical protein